jgi:hypothetical protein
MHFFVLEGKEEKYEMENPESAYTIGSEGKKVPLEPSCFFRVQDKEG